MNGRTLALLLPAGLGIGGLGCGEKQQGTGDTGEVQTCAEGWLADRGACVPEACGVGTWGELPMDGSTIHVDIDAPEGGDGSAEAPLRSIQPALDLAGSRGGALVAVAAGTYAETVVMDSDHAGVHLAGRCRELVTLDASGGGADTPGIDIGVGYGEAEVSGLAVVGSSWVGVLATSGRLRLLDLSVEGSGDAGIATYQGSGSAPSSLEADSCELKGNTGRGVVAFGAGTAVVLVDTTVRETRTDESGAFGYGIQVYGGATLSCEGCDLTDNSTIGIVASDLDTAVALADTRVQGTLTDGSGDDGYGIQVQDGATLTAGGCSLAGNATAGVAALGPGTEVALVNTVIRDTLPDEDGAYGYGVVIRGGAALSAEGCELDGNTAGGIWATEQGTEAMLTDTRVRDSLTDRNGDGFGIHVQAGAELRAEGCDSTGNTGVGVLVSDPGTAVTLVDTRILDTQQGGDEGFGYAIQVSDGATLTAEGCELAGNATLGVLAGDPGTVVALADTWIQDTLAENSEEGGHGIMVQSGAVLTGERCELFGNTGVGIAAREPDTAVALVDTTVRCTLQDGSGEGGYGIEVHSGAALLAEGCELAGNTTVGVKATQTGTTVALVNTLIRDTLPAPTGEAGRGIEVWGGMSITVDGCELADNTDTGLLADGLGTRVAIRDSSITGTLGGTSEDGAAAPALNAQRGAAVIASGLLAQHNEGPGLYAVGGGARLSCTECSLLDNAFAGAVVTYEGDMDIHASTISDTRESADLGGGVGIFAADQLSLGAPSLRVTDTTITHNPVAGAYLAGEGSYQLSGNTIEGGTGVSHGATSRCGDGVYAAGTTAWDGNSGLTLEGNAISDNAGAGLFLDDASAQLDGNSWDGNDPALWVQGESCLAPRDDWTEAPSSEICPIWDRPSCALMFSLNFAITEPAMAPSPAVRPYTPQLALPPGLDSRDTPR